MDAALRRVLGAQAPESAEPPEGLATAEIERRIAARLAAAGAALACRPEPLAAGAAGRAAAYSRLGDAALAQMPEDAADAFRLRLALDLCDLEAELERRGR